jgi:succinate-semialdehyde dehydrogenase/glutarate-semialdehyde dehydrogenase
MQNFVDDALARGASFVAGQACRQGTFPRHRARACSAAARVRQVEPFGPIALLQPFSTLDEVLAEANRLAVGLSAYAFTRDLATAHRLSEELEAGMVGINHFGVSQPETPFGGWKESGMGQESGMEGLLAYTEVKLVSIAA